MSAEEKAQTDRIAWAKWLVSYRSHVRALAPAPPALTASAAEWSAWYNGVQALDIQRAAVMSHANPKFILRNYLAQRAIELAEAGEYSEVQNLMALLRDPYDLHGTAAALKLPHAADNAPVSGTACTPNPTQAIATHLSFEYV